MERDRNGLEVLSRDECVRLLASSGIGRIGLTSSALPLVLPVNFTVWRDSIVIRTTAGTKLDAAARSAVVAFEVDEADRVEHSGWSVVVTGVADRVTDPDDLAELRSTGPAPWGVEGDRFVRISIDMISGRRVRAAARPLIHLVDNRSNMEVLHEDECVRFLGEENVGRLALIDGGHPVLFPVNYVWDDGAVVLRSDARPLLGAGRMAASFEIDHLDRAHRCGWSVIVDGVLEEVTEYHEHRLLARLRTVPVEPWAPGEKSHWFRIVPRRITGRRVAANSQENAS